MSGEFWNIIRIGIVQALDYDRARAKVTFEELEITSDWLPVLQRSAGATADYWLPGLGEHVVCIFYSDGTEEGCIVGSYYRAGDPPPDGGAGVFYTVFPDGSLVKWDNGALTITAAGGVTINADIEATGEVIINGNVRVNGTVEAHQFVDIMP